MGVNSFHGRGDRRVLCLVAASLGLSPDLPFAFNLKLKLFRLKAHISVCEQKGNYREKTNFHQRGGGQARPHCLSHGPLPAEGPAQVLLLQQGELGQFLLLSSLSQVPLRKPFTLILAELGGQ